MNTRIMLGFNIASGWATKVSLYDLLAKYDGARFINYGADNSDFRTIQCNAKDAPNIILELWFLGAKDIHGRTREAGREELETYLSRVGVHLTLPHVKSLLSPSV